MSSNTLRAPIKKGAVTPCKNPVAWPSGAGIRNTSCQVKFNRAQYARSLARILLWVNITPFGIPSVPEVNSTAASSSP
ncbi:Uncharacterised protein [Salmonella enterica subsp. enterica serovar Bovismorbificans]|uniref:Uncharacterized protein n=1 Tax=Salmonella enterica subsp. enterica serovar Bovismorbificans TaxID=58097 RepID=A0A655C349_SALET|nr:Uncharacterised protein [Salmonella enterica subsp. enterica serovar Bovismorbificans]